MKSCDPLVGDNAYETLDGMIEALQWQIAQLSRFMNDPSEETLKAGLTVEEILCRPHIYVRWIFAQREQFIRRA